MKYIEAFNYIFGMAQAAPATAQEHMRCQQAAQIIGPILAKAEKAEPDDKKSDAPAQSPAEPPAKTPTPPAKPKTSIKK